MKFQIYNTSIVNAKFRVARITPDRDLSFDHDRELDFNYDRDIDARIKGVVFRDKALVGFQNLGISNLDDVMNPEEWPDTGKAEVGEAFHSERDSEWDDRWGGGEEEKGKAYRKTAPFSGQPHVSWEVVEPLPDTSYEKQEALSQNQYGVTLVRKGEYSTALLYFMKAAQLDPTNKTYRLNISKCKEWIAMRDRRTR